MIVNLKEKKNINNFYSYEIEISNVIDKYCTFGIQNFYNLYLLFIFIDTNLHKELLKLIDLCFSRTSLKLFL